MIYGELHLMYNLDILLKKRYLVLKIELAKIEKNIKREKNQKKFI